MTSNTSNSEDDSEYLDSETWIQWYCNQAGNEFFCEVDRAFIEDNFNLYGIKNYLVAEDYNFAMDVILDKSGI